MRNINLAPRNIRENIIHKKRIEKLMLIFLISIIISFIIIFILVSYLINLNNKANYINTSMDYEEGQVVLEDLIYMENLINAGTDISESINPINTELLSFIPLISQNINIEAIHIGDASYITGYTTNNKDIDDLINKMDLYFNDIELDKLSFDEGIYFFEISFDSQVLYE